MNWLRTAGTILLAWAGMPALAPGQRPTMEGFTLGAPLSSTQPRLGSCNPPIGRPAEYLRWCFAAPSATPLTLIFLDDSLVQLGFTFTVEGTSLNAEAQWRQRADTFRTLLGSPPDTIMRKPARGNIVARGVDPRGDSAQVLRALWRASPTHTWCASVLLVDDVVGDDTPITRGYVDVYTALKPHSACELAAYR